ncbi:hypothetical protein ACH5AJ_36580 [Streptomyces rochei]|uniref:hypothetical protein n=1 Tax=Streptomyces rochei TaxID=1928 RepID=UPI0037996A16
MPRSNRYDRRCDYCGRFMPWAWVSTWNCFAGYAKGWCQRLACGRAADRDQGLA